MQGLFWSTFGADTTSCLPHSIDRSKSQAAQNQGWADRLHLLMKELQSHIARDAPQGGKPLEEGVLEGTASTAPTLQCEDPGSLC